jgi:cytochrome b
MMVLLIAISWWTAENQELEYHRYSGYALLGLLVFRLYWGFAGSTTARFAHFIRGPRETWRYARTLLDRTHSHRVVGHNPLGGWSIVVLLTLLATQIVLGLFAVDVDGIESGPLASFVSFDVGRDCAHWHHRIFNALLAFIALHVAAALYYTLLRGHNVIASMLHGKTLASTTAQPIEFATAQRAVLGIALAAGVVWLIARMG